MSSAPLLVIKLCSLLVKSGDYSRHLPPFEHLEQGVRDVEQAGLKEEDEGDPLVVGVHPPVVLVRGLGPHPLVRPVNPVYTLVLG